MGTRWATHTAGNDTAAVVYFVPRDELKVEDADLSLVSLTTRVFSDDEVADPWFNMTVKTTTEIGGTIWLAPREASILACLEQYQFCVGGTCSKLDALHPLRQARYGLDLTPEQTAVADLLWKSLWAAQLQYVLFLVGNQLLVANEAVMGSYYYLRSLKLPVDQWVVEAQNMANTSLAVLQRRPVDYASPQTVLQDNPRQIVPPESDMARALCEKVIIRTARYTSFKVLGLLLLLLFTLLLAALNLALPRLASHPDWLRYGFFQLLRLALEGSGVGPWVGLANSCPALVGRSEEFSLREIGTSDGKDGLAPGDSERPLLSPHRRFISLGGPSKE